MHDSLSTETQLHPETMQSEVVHSFDGEEAIGNGDNSDNSDNSDNNGESDNAADGINKNVGLSEEKTASAVVIAINNTLDRTIDETTDPVDQVERVEHLENINHLDQADQADQTDHIEQIEQIDQIEQIEQIDQVAQSTADNVAYTQENGDEVSVISLRTDDSQFTQHRAIDPFDQSQLNELKMDFQKKFNQLVQNSDEEVAKSESSGQELEPKTPSSTQSSVRSIQVSILQTSQYNEVDSPSSARNSSSTPHALRNYVYIPSQGLTNESSTAILPPSEKETIRSSLQNDMHLDDSIESKGDKNLKNSTPRSQRTLKNNPFDNSKESPRSSNNFMDFQSTSLSKIEQPQNTEIPSNGGTITKLQIHPSQWLQIPALYHHKSCLYISDNRSDNRSDNSSEEHEVVLYLSGGETMNSTWKNSIYIYPLLGISENGQPLINKQNPSRDTKLLSFDSKTFPARDSHGVILWNNNLVFIGGNVAIHDTKGSDVYLVSLEHNSVRKLRFKIGEQSNEKQREEYLSDLSSSEHDIQFVNTKLPQTNRRLHTLTYIGDDKILMVGGIAINPYRPLFTPKVEEPETPTILQEAWIFDLKMHLWIEVAKPPEFFYGHSAVFDPIQQCVFVFGGRNHTNERMNDIHIYNPQKNVWRRIDDVKGAIPIPREEHAACINVERRCMVIYGGWTATGPRSDCFTFAFNTKIWTRVAIGEEKSRNPRFGHNCECVGDTVIIYGGKNDRFELLDTFEQVHPWDTHPC